MPGGPCATGEHHEVNPTFDAWVSSGSFFRTVFLNSSTLSPSNEYLISCLDIDGVIFLKSVVLASYDIFRKTRPGRNPAVLY
jgi:hypothetical protein